MLDRRFAIAPMMDWTESAGGSMVWRCVCAKFVHTRSPFLLLSFLSGSRTPTPQSTIKCARVWPFDILRVSSSKGHRSTRTRRVRPTILAPLSTHAFAENGRLVWDGYATSSENGRGARAQMNLYHRGMLFAASSRSGQPRLEGPAGLSDRSCR